MRKSARALIIEDKKLLLVTGLGANYYWSPGGGIDEGETAEEALSRELLEELGVSVKEASLYSRDSVPKDNVAFEYFLASISGGVTPSNEVSEYLWYSRKNFEDKHPRVTPWLTAKIIPQLIKDGLL